MKYEIIGILGTCKIPPTLTQLVRMLGRPKKDVSKIIEAMLSEGQIKEVYVGLDTCYKLA